MQIAFSRPLAVGNAVQLLLTPPSGAVHWRVLRRTSDAFVGPSDPGAYHVVDATDDHSVLDTAGLENGTPYVYRAWSWDGAVWSAPSDPVTVTPAATYADLGPDPQSLVRDRLELGLRIEVARGTLKPASGTIQVLTAPYALEGSIAFPMAVVRLSNDAPATRGIGEGLLPDERQDDGFWSESESYLSRVTLMVQGISRNSDERIEMRKAIKRVVMANLPVFSDAGMTEIEFSQTDNDDFQEKSAPLFYTDGSFTCLSPAVVSDTIPPVREVNATEFDYQEVLHG